MYTRSHTHEHYDFLWQQSKFSAMLMSHKGLNLTLTHTYNHPWHVKGTSPPGVAENNQIILSGDTTSFRRGGDGASSPLLYLHLTVSL